MKTRTAILVIALLILAVTLPVSAAKDSPGNAKEAPGPETANTGQGQNINNLSVDAAAGPVVDRNTVQEELQAENRQGAGTGIVVENRTRERAEVQTVSLPQGQNITVIRATIRQNRDQLNATLRNTNPARAGQVANDNEVRLAVHTLLAMENITGGIGPQVSTIARDFNNSAQNTWQLEERIQNRDAISRFFFGGDRISAAELANLTAQNQNRIRQIEQLMNSEQLDAETRAMLEEQIQIMQEENARLGQVAAAEQQNRGLLGWFGQ